MKVGVHRDYHLTLGGTETTEEGGTFTVVAAKLYAMDAGVLASQVFDDSPTAVGTAIVDENNFVGEMILCHDALDPSVKFGQAFILIVERNDNGDLYSVFHII